MPVRLNITVDEDVHERLKRELPATGISRFINEAVRARLRSSRAALDDEYKAVRASAGDSRRRASGGPQTPKVGPIESTAPTW
jgi:hypothetical protein